MARCSVSSLVFADQQSTLFEVVALSSLQTSGVLTSIYLLALSLHLL